MNGIYIPFIAGHFETRNRRILTSDIERVYSLFKGHSYYIKKTFNEAFADTPYGDACTHEILKQTMGNLIAGNATIFREILYSIGNKEVTRKRHCYRDKQNLFGY